MGYGDDDVMVGVAHASQNQNYDPGFIIEYISLLCECGSVECALPPASPPPLWPSSPDTSALPTPPPPSPPATDSDSAKSEEGYKPGEKTPASSLSAPLAPATVDISESPSGSPSKSVLELELDLLRAEESKAAKEGERGVRDMGVWEGTAGRDGGKGGGGGIGQGELGEQFVAS